MFEICNIWRWSWEKGISINVLDSLGKLSETVEGWTTETHFNYTVD